MTETLTYSGLNGLQEAVLLLDHMRHVLFANKAAEAAFGSVTKGTDIVRTIRHPQLISMINQASVGDVVQDETITVESPVRITFNARVTSLADCGAAKIIISLMDVSGQRQSEQMRSDFVANVSHELRSPLTALAGLIETLQGPAKNDPQAHNRFLALMEGETSRMARLVSDLLALSRLEADQRLLPNEKVDLVKNARRVAVLLKELASNENKTIKLNTDSPEYMVTGSADRITQLIQNLIENAVKYSEAGSTIEVEIAERSNVAGMSGPVVAIVIKDQGKGIAKEHLSRLTERFYRVDDDRSREKGGTGLGLAIVKHIVSQHRGRLKIESEVGLGSTFTVFLPLSH